VPRLSGLRAARGAAAGGDFVRPSDRHIVARLAGTRELIGQATMQMVSDKAVDGQLPPSRLRALARALANISTELDGRADEISGTSAVMAHTAAGPETRQRTPEAVAL
jgi:hypothetical protein